MNRIFRSSLYIFTITAVLLMSVMGTTTVYADGGTSDDPAVTEPPSDPPEETLADETASDPAPGEEPAADSSEDAPPPEETPESSSADEIPPVETASVEDPVEIPEILEQVPEGTDLVVLNEEGTPEPLASEVAAEILVEGDPIWCPDGQAPTPGANGCTASHTGFDDLIADLTGGTYSGDGVIWVESTYDANEDNSSIIFDGTSGNLAALSAISVLGGWNGVSGSTSTDTSSPSLLDDPMIFTNWSGAVSLSNLEFQGAVEAWGSVQVETDGDITVSDLSVSGNTGGAGTILDNCVGAGACTGSGDILVTDSDFSSNTGTGLGTLSTGDVTIKNVTADNNTVVGLNLNTDNGNANNVKLTDVTVTNSGNDGIHIHDVDGNVTLKNITATDNGDGVEIDDTHGNVYGSNITATGNFNDGVDIDNTNGSVTLSNVTASNNDDNGFEIDYADGDIKLYCVTASNNDGDGVNIDTNGNVIIKCSTVTDNGEDGVDIALAPTAQLLSVTTTGNGDQDIEVDPGTTLIIKKVDCSGKTKPKSKPVPDKGLYTKLYCLPGEIKVALYDTYGDKVEFTNLCGYEAGVFDPDSGAYPKAIPGGGDEYITSLHNKVLESLPNLEPDTEHGLAGMYAQVLDELPYILPEDYSYSSAFFTVVLEDGEYMDPLPEESSLTIRFRVPDGLDEDEELTILWWDGLDWVDLGGEYSEDGYYFQVTTEEIGVFVLAIFESES